MQPKKAAAILIVISGIILNFLFINASKPSAYDVLVSPSLPPGVPRITTQSSSCFRPGELEALKVWATSRENSFAVQLCNYRPFANPIPVVRGNQYYLKNTGGSIFECARYRRNHALTSLVTTATTQISDYANNMMNSTKIADRQSGAKCLARVYLHWAERNGFAKTESDGDIQPEFVQMWSAGVLASVYARYRKEIQAQARVLKTNSGKVYADVIHAWLLRLGSVVYTQIVKEEQKSTPTKPTGRNNIAYWRGYALLATAVNTQNLVHFKKSQQIFDIGMDEVTGDSKSNFASEDKGFLPLELDRRARALSYHQFSLQPLAGMANLSAAMSCDFLRSDSQLWKMAFLIRKTTEGSRNPSIFAQAAFCQVNGSCETPRNAPFSAFVQTAAGNGEPYFPLISNSNHKEIIRNRVTTYLKAKKIQFRDYTGHANIQRNLGGDLRFAPSYGSLKPTHPALRGYCRL